jgi:hypothetical protein
VPFNGVEWAFLMQDLGYNQSGVKYLTDVELKNLKEESTVVLTASKNEDMI